jgi:GntR family transcriptional regulator, transcriptional repressor for pyruvate dehydrogenase complex
MTKMETKDRFMLPKLSRGTLAEQVTENLLAFIDSQNLKPGDLLPSETSLSTSFGVSRPVIREALKNLEGKGIIEIINGKGALVKPIDSDPLRLFFQRAMQLERSTILELMEVRKGLEVQAVMLAAKRRQENDLVNIRRLVCAMRNEIHHPLNYAALDTEYHLAIASATHNTILFYLVESIRESLLHTISTGLKVRHRDDQFERIQELHEKILQLITEGDVVGAAESMALHFDEAIEAIATSEA